MRAAYWLLIGSLGLGGSTLAQADEGNGLALPQLQGRVGLGIEGSAVAARLSGSSDQPARLGDASLLGNYYFGRYSTREGDDGGFRTTTGVYLGSRLGMWSGRSSGAPGGGLVSFERQSLSLLAPTQSTDVANPESGTVPYFGIGYSGSSLKGGWGFSADLGLMALNPGGAARLGRMFGGGQTLDDAVRELRLSPMVQFGASYSF